MSFYNFNLTLFSRWRSSDNGYAYIILSLCRKGVGYGCIPYRNHAGAIVEKVPDYHVAISKVSYGRHGHTGSVDGTLDAQVGLVLKFLIAFTFCCNIAGRQHHNGLKLTARGGNIVGFIVQGCDDTQAVACHSRWAYKETYRPIHSARS